MRLRRFFSKPALAAALKEADVALIYGTHTGNSKQTALRLQTELQWRLKLKTISGSCDEFDHSDLESIHPSKIVLYFITSYNHGGPTKDAAAFWNSIFSSTKTLQNLQFSVFGRGSSAYQTFNHAGIALDAKLAALGATRLAPYGQQDKLALDREEPYFNWKESLITALLKKYNLEEQPLVYTPTHTIHKSPANTKWSPKPQEILTSLALRTRQRPAPEYAPVTAKLTKDEFGREFVHATFDLARTSQLYETGDYLVVWPTNSELEAAKFLKAFNLNPSQIVTIDSQWTCTYEYLARHFIDINAKPNRELLRYFIGFAPNPRSKQNLQDICASHHLFETCLEKHFNIGRLLLACSDGEPWPIPDTMILDILPSLEPRDFSISSSPLNDPQSVSIGLVVEKNKEWNGVATNFLKNITQGEPVPVCTEISDFKLPQDSSLPIVMIGVGTGTSPYRGFVEERKELKLLGANLGKAYLFAGFRSPDSFQYADFFRNAPQLQVHTAYSRVGGDARMYVQDLLKEHGEKIYDLINQGAYFYVCGSARLLKRHIRGAIIEIIAENAGISRPAAKLQFKVLKREGRIRQDVW